MRTDKSEEIREIFKAISAPNAEIEAEFKKYMNALLAEESFLMTHDYDNETYNRPLQAAQALQQCMKTYNSEGVFNDAEFGDFSEIANDAGFSPEATIAGAAVLLALIVFLLLGPFLLLFCPPSLPFMASITIAIWPTVGGAVMGAATVAVAASAYYEPVINSTETGGLLAHKLYKHAHPVESSSIVSEVSACVYSMFRLNGRQQLGDQSHENMIEMTSCS